MLNGLPPLHGRTTRRSSRFFATAGQVPEELEQRVLLASQIAAWDFETGTGNDSVGAADGLLQAGAAIFSDPQKGPALRLDGDNDVFKINHEPALLLGDGNSDFSVTFHVKLLEDATGRYRRLIHKGAASTDRTLAVMLRPNSNRLHFRISTTASFNEGGNSRQALLVNQWTHIAYVKSGNELQLYIDGKLDTAVSLQGTVVANTGPLWVGDAPFGKSAATLVDDLRIYAGALSAQDVTTDIVHGAVARYDFNTGAAVDLEGTAHGTLLNGATTVQANGSQAVSLDGIDDQLLIDHQAAVNLGANNADFSFSLRVNLQEDATGEWRSLIRKGDNWDTRTPTIQLHPTTNNLHFRASTTEFWNEGGDSFATLRVGEWTDISVVKAGDQLLLYVNGFLDQTASLNADTTGNNGPWSIGNSIWAAATNMLVDDFILYDRAITADEVRIISKPRAAIAGDLGGSNTGSNPKTISFTRSLKQPVVFFGPPSENDSSPGVVQVNSVTNSAAEWQFREWNYLDGEHATENVSWLALEPGRYVFPDGGVWEVGTRELSASSANGQFRPFQFSTSFPATPAVFLSPQTSNGSQSFHVRARDVHADGFSAALEEEESSDNGHAAETIAYLAIYHPDRSGTAVINGQSYAWNVKSVDADETAATVNQHSVRVQEEQSFDQETGHIQESIDVLQIDNRIFAQSTTYIDPDTAALRVQSNPTRQFGDHLYLRTPHKMTWQVAQAWAERVGGNLVTINNATEDAWLQQNFGRSTAYWTGLNDAKNEGNFTWASGEPVTYTNWLSGEPNDGGAGQDYVRTNKSASRQWADANGSAELYGLVEIGGASFPQSGLLAEYFSDPNLTNFVFSGIDGGINFNWQTSAPSLNLPADFFSVRWTGLIEAQYSETYTFHATANDGIRLWVNDTLLIDQWVTQDTTHSGTISLEAGERYNIRVDYFDGTGPARVMLEWSSSSQPRVVIPAEQLFPGNGQSFAADGSGFTTELIAGNLIQPIAFAAADDGRIFVAEKEGRVKVVENGVVTSTFIDLTARINSGHDRGLIGIALDPDFATNGHVYLNYTVETNPQDPDSSDPDSGAGGELLRVTESVSNPGTADLTTQVVVLDGHVMTHNTHSVGDVDFDNDGNLIFTWGDGGFDPALRLSSQDPNSKQGKVFRIDRATFAGVPGNPFYDANDPHSVASKVWAVGVRNSWRLSVDRQTGDVYLGEVTDQGPEEINVLRANSANGSNLGWPYFEGDNPTSYGTPPANFSQQLPFIELPHQDILGAGDAVLGGTVFRGDAYPEVYDGRYFFGNFSTGTFFTSDITGEFRQFGNVGDFTGVVDLQAGPDGHLWMVNLFFGQIQRLVPDGGLGLNLKPTVVTTASVSAGPAPLAVTFDATESFDPNGDQLSFAWDFDSDGIVDSTASSPTHIFDSSGKHTTTLIVHDNNGGIQRTEIETRVVASDPVDGNLAFGKPTRQSSTNAGLSSRAVDGVSNSAFAGGSVSRTTQERTPYWEVDLGTSHNLASISITPDGDVALSDYWILVSDAPFSSGNLDAALNDPNILAIHNPNTAQPVQTSSFAHTGRYVRIQRASVNSVLALAEVQVFAPVPGTSMGSGGGGSSITAETIPLDIDGDGVAQPLTDGILITRFLAGFTGTALTRGAVNSASTLLSAPQIEARLSALYSSGQLDVDANGLAQPLSDGIIVTRHLAGFTGSALTNAVAPASDDGQEFSRQINAQLQALTPASTDDDSLDELFAGLTDELSNA